MAEAKTKGLVSILVLFSFFVYYTFWMLITPFIDQSQKLLEYFPDRKWGYIVPIMMGLMVLVIMFTFSGLVLIEENRQAVAKRTEEEIIEKEIASQTRPLKDYSIVKNHKTLDKI